MEFQVDSVVQWTGFTLVNFFLSIYNHSINLYIYIFINLYIYKFIYLYIYIYVLCMKCWSQLIYWIFNHWINLQFYIEFHRCSIWYTNSCYVIHQHSWHRAFVRDQLISLVKQCGCSRMTNFVHFGPLKNLNPPIFFVPSSPAWNSDENAFF